MIGRCADGRVTDSIPPIYDYDLMVLAGFILLLLVLISEPLGVGFGPDSICAAAWRFVYRSTIYPNPLQSALVLFPTFHSKINMQCQECTTDNQIIIHQ